MDITVDTGIGHAGNAVQPAATASANANAFTGGVGANISATPSGAIDSMVSMVPSVAFSFQPE